MHSLSSCLSLTLNQIGDRGATAIGEALKVNGALTIIGLGANNIHAQGVAAIAEALKVNGALKTMG